MSSIGSRDIEVRHAAAGNVTPAAPLPRHIAAAVAGNALEFYDFVTYAFFAVQIGRTFFPAQNPYASLMLSLATFGVGFITRPVGAFVIGRYADRAGRRAAMTLSFVMMGTAVAVLALTPPYASIGAAAPALVLLARLAQGFSLGGEVGPATAYLLEAAPIERRGLIVAWQGASQGIAAIAGGTVGVVLSAALTPAQLEAYGWRFAFLLGALMLPFGLWIRRGLPETLDLPDALPAPDAHPATDTHPAIDARAAIDACSALDTARDGRSALDAHAVRRHRRIIVLALLVLASGTIATYVRNYMTTFAQATLHLNADAAFGATVAANAAAVAAMLYGGRLSDRVGRRPVMIWWNLAFLIAVYPTFLWIVEARNTLALLAGSALLGFLGSVAAGAFYPALTESLPKHIRGGAVALTYAVAIAAFGGTTQLAVTWLIRVTDNPLAPAGYVIATGIVGQAAMFLMRESAPVAFSRAD
jgi:MFS family permease